MLFFLTLVGGVKQYTSKGLFQSLLQSWRSKASVRAAPFNFESSQDAKRFIPLLLQISHGIFHPPSKTVQLPSDTKQKSTTSSCLVPPVRGWRAGWLGTECHLPQLPSPVLASRAVQSPASVGSKSRAKLPLAVEDFVSSPKDCISPFPLG